MRLPALLALACAAPLLLLLGCGSSPAPDPGTTATAPTTTATPTAATTSGSAAPTAALRARLAQIARQSGDASAPGWGVTDAWLAAIPDLATEAGGFAPPPGGVSATPDGVYLKGDIQEQVLPFAVVGSDGSCAGAIVIALDGALAARDVTLPGGSDCTAIAVATAAEDGPPIR